jgi:lysophospholipase L1-like esterase
MRDVRDKVARDCEIVRGPKPVPPPPPPTPPADALYIALGDSISAGVGASTRDNGFVAIYFARLRADGLLQQLSNRAVSGATAADVLAGQLPRALGDIAGPSDTKVMTVTVGGNDSRDAACRPAGAPSCPFAPNLRAIVERLQGALAEDPGDEQIQISDRYNPLVGTSQGAGFAVSLLGTDGRAGCGDTGWNDVIYCVALEKGATFVDTYTPMLAGGRAYLADEAHPNDAGHAALAQAFYGALRNSVRS